MRINTANVPKGSGERRRDKERGGRIREKEFGDFEHMSITV